MNSRRRRGLTLTELLVVGTIILAVTAISIPVVKPMMESQLTKNGANMVAAALNRARNRAVANGRSCGVRFEYWPGTKQEYEEAYKFEDDETPTFVNSETHYSQLDENGISYTIDTYYSIPGSSLVLRQVEVPPIYSGLLGLETVKHKGGSCCFQNDPYVEKALGETTNGKIQFGGSGPFYAFEPNSLVLKGRETDNLTYALPPERETEYPFKILLDSRTTMTMPVCLPRGAAVDLQFSGIGDTLFMDKFSGINVPDPPVVTSLTMMFAPDGSVESVGGTIPTEPVHFLIGRWEQTSAVRLKDDAESLPNYADGRNFWVTVFPQTGAVTVSQVNPTDDLGYDPLIRVNDYNDDVPDVRLRYGVIAISRELTR